MKKYFVFDSEENIMDFYDTPEEAKKEAERILDLYRDTSVTDGWPEWKLQIMWGEIKEATTKTQTIYRKDYSEEEWQEMTNSTIWDEIHDYEFKEVK